MESATPASDRLVFAAAIFALKTFAAAILSLFISFWLALDDPYWALLTVFVVAQPDSGSVLAKGFYRLLGTVVGVLVTTALVFAFAQYGELFIASLAAWVGVCSFAARGRRNYTSYSFQLAGYTAAIIGVPAALATNGAYTLIIARCTEISLGIACMGLVSCLIFPSNLAPKLMTLAHGLFRRVDRFAENATDPSVDQMQLVSERQALAKDFGEVETMRSSSFFESAEARLVDPLLRGALHAAVSLCAAAEAVATNGRSQFEQDSNRGCAITEAGGGANENDASPTTFALVGAADQRTLNAARASLATRVGVLASGETAPEGSVVAAPLWSDPLTAAITGMRSALAVVMTAAFWFLTAWPTGSTAVVVAACASTLLATTNRPEKVSAAAGVTILLFAVPLFVTQFCLLPYALDTLSMAAVLAPFLLICAFIVTHPSVGPLGLLATVYLAVTTHINNNNVQTYDALAFFNTSLAILFGIGISVGLFATFFPETPQWAARRFFRLVCVNLSRLASDRNIAFSAFNLALCENLASTLATLKDEPTLARDCLLCGEIGLSSSSAIERLRTGMADRHKSGMTFDSEGELLTDLSRAYRSPSWAGLARSASEARVESQRLLARASATKRLADRMALRDLAVGCEALRSNVMKMRMLLIGEQRVHRS